MTNSTHYNLNLVEGTDLVNPLVQDVPNYEAIDAQMYSNECASIGTAVELLTGTVHALTRTNTDTPVFRFTATADYEAGETFVVDGVQVTALLPSGEALGTGAYVIGSEVLCVLRDTRLTFFMAGGIQSVAADSDKLGGQLPAYYGTAADVQTAQSTATAAGVLAQANASQITSINESLVNKSDKITYSTDSVDTGNKWLDGKTIYRKVIPLDLTTTSEHSISIGDSVESVINTYGNLNYNGYIRPINSSAPATTSTTICCIVRNNAHDVPNTLRLMFGNDLVGVRMYGQAIIEYTRP